MSMTRLSFTALAMLVFLGLSGAWAPAHAVLIASQGTAADSGEFNSVGPTIALTPDPRWFGPLPGSSWVSFGNTGAQGPGFFQVTNGTIVTFTQQFVLPAAVISGSITVLADDSTSVSLNGTLLVAEAPTSSNTYTGCSDTPIGCREATKLTLDLPTGLLVAGLNTLTFSVAQRGLGPFGLNYFGEVLVPEPSTLLLLGASLLGSGGVAAVYRRLRRS